VTVVVDIVGKILVQSVLWGTSSGFEAAIKLLKLVSPNDTCAIVGRSKLLCYFWEALPHASLTVLSFLHYTQAMI
jgi:hypothetical protein